MNSNDIPARSGETGPCGLTRYQMFMIRRELVGAKHRWEELDATDARNLCLKLDLWLGTAEPSPAAAETPDSALEQLCKVRCYFCRAGDVPVLNPATGCYLHSDNFQEGPETGSWPFTCDAAEIRKAYALVAPAAGKAPIPEEPKLTILASACQGRNGFPPYHAGPNPVMMRCPEGHVSAIKQEDFDNLGEIGSYFECPWCQVSTGRIHGADQGDAH